jgi:hypothetical protein
MEAATYSPPFFYATTSLSSSAPEQRLLTRFVLDARNGRMVDERSVDLVDNLKEALHQAYGDDWYNSWKDLAAKAGGLNIEGMSRPAGHGDTVLLGLRSPLIGGNFPADLYSGDAIIAKVAHPFGPHPQFSFQRVPLGGYGFRGFEWIPALHKYVISAGPVEKATDYHLWQLSPSGSLAPLDLPGYDELCRPESLIQQDDHGHQHLVVLSDASVPECAGVPFTFIKAEILHGHACDNGHGHGHGHH